MNWYLKVLKEYANFKGRARRKEYWMFFLINTIISMVLGFTAGLIGGATDNLSIVSVANIYSLLVLIPSLAVLVRRLHDIGKSGWYFFIIFIPLIGVIWLIVLLCQDSEDGTNEYGPNPKNPSDELNEIGVAE